jgi:hypothetical protein
MLRGIVFILFLTIQFHTQAQKRVQWSLDYASDSSCILINAVIEKGWHLYSQYIAPEAGPVPTSFSFDESKDLNYLGKVIEPKPIVEYDHTFETELMFFSGKVQFKQQIDLIKNTTIGLTVRYMVCNAVMCMPPTEEYLTIELKK